jgi:ketosteroid isomerase-like protein
MSNEIEVVKKIFAAINRNDIVGMIAFFDPQIVRIEPEGHATAGVWRGHEEVKAHFIQGRSTWAEGSCEPVKFEVVGDKVIAFLHVQVRLKNKTEWIDGRIADVFTFRNGKVIQMQTFWENEEAIEWVKANS